MPIPIVAGIVRAAAGAVTRTAGQSIIRSTLSGFGDSMKDVGKGVASIKPKVTVDTRGFNMAFKKYMQECKRDIVDVVNTKAYFIARNAVQMTEAVDKNKIEQELRAASELYPNAPLAAILAAKAQNRTRISKKTGKQLKDKAGLYGSRMTAAMEKIIRVHKASSNFLRSGWIPAIKALERVAEKGGAPRYPNTKTYGTPKGGARSARQNSTWRPSSEIWNSVTGGIKKHGLDKQSNPSAVQKILQEGLQKAINKEEASMKAYVEKKLAARAAKFNRS